jgi:hypothetical protein
MKTDLSNKFVVIDLDDLRETPDDIRDIINNAHTVLFKDDDDKHIILKN